MDYSRLSKEVSYALRHAPWEYELELDPEGWVEIDQFLHALHVDNQWRTVGESDLAAMIEVSDKKRHEIEGGKIRALYGHSLPDKISKIPECPPPAIYHGTAKALLEEIMKTGLQPMGRQYVHLSADQETAISVGKRKDSNPVLLGIHAEKAWQDGMKFYRGNNMIWLADYVSPQYIFVINPL